MGLFEFHLIDDVRIVVIPGGDNRISTQAQHRSESFREFVVLHKPTRRLGTEPDAKHEDEGRDEC